VKTETLALLSVVLLAFGCGGHNAPSTTADDTSNFPSAKQALGSAAPAGGGTATINSCSAICATLAAYGSDPESACAAYCVSPAGMLDVDLCDWCPGSNISVNGLVGCTDAFTACQGYHCIAQSAPVVPSFGNPGVDAGSEADGGTEGGLDAGTPTAVDAGVVDSLWACVANQPNSTPSFVCVMLNSPECTTTTNAEFCASLPLASGEAGPDFVFLYVPCDPADDGAHCARDTGVR
jgi:hypothetical protein